MTTNYPIENQVCTLEQAKKLTDLLGEKAPGSLWVYVKEGKDGWNAQPRLRRPVLPKWWKQIAAYTGDELGTLLPEMRKESSLRIEKYEGQFEAGYYPAYSDYDGGEAQANKIEAHAKADLAIHLLDQKIIKPKEFNYFFLFKAEQ